MNFVPKTGLKSQSGIMANLCTLVYSMSVFVYGINFKTAPVEIREKTVLSGEKLESSLIEIRKKLANINEIFIVSTCNRTEFYYSTSSDASSNLETWLSGTSGLSQSTLKDISYQYSADKLLNTLSALHQD